jgi:hypothetical protein
VPQSASKPLGERAEFGVAELSVHSGDRGPVSVAAYLSQEQLGE